MRFAKQDIPVRTNKIDQAVEYERMIERGIAFHQSGELDKAEACYRKVLTSLPDHAGALHLLGVIMHQSGQSLTGIDMIERALKQLPDFADAHKNLAYILEQQGDTEGAIEHYRKAADHAADPLDSLIELGRLLLDGGNAAAALTTYDDAVRIAPDDFRGHLGRGNALLALEKFAEAAEAGEAALRTAPDDAQLHFDVAGIFRKLKKNEDAVRHLERAIDIRPDYVEAYLNLSNAVRDLGEKQRAIDLLSKAIEIKPTYAEAYSNLGSILIDEAMFEEALDCYRRAIEIDPKLPEAYVNLGSAMQILCLPEQALKAFQIALTLKPDQDAALWNLALTLHANGEVEDGWDIYGYGFASKQRNPYRPFPGLIWQGEDLKDKTIMVWREQGIGDDLHFSTCYHDLVEKAGHVVIECPPRLVDLYQRTWPRATVRAETVTSTGLGNYGQVDFDYTAPAGIAASILRRHIADFPSTARPLIADPEKRAAARDWLAGLGPEPKIGLSWRSSIKNPLRDVFATDLADWADLIRRQDVKIVNLQYGREEEDILKLQQELGLEIHRMPGLDTYNDLEGVAALTAELDLMVGSWNAAAEMAGAVAIPGLIFMPSRHSVQLGCPNLPWHPTMTVYPVMPGFDAKALTAKMTGDALSLLRNAGKL
ncbi:MAG TPA: tetratricopeptide repeat protein [Parvibaculum sp.]